jgi:hypothetical protein
MAHAIHVRAIADQVEADRDISGTEWDSFRQTFLLQKLLRGLADQCSNEGKRNRSFESALDLFEVARRLRLLEIDLREAEEAAKQARELRDFELGRGFAMWTTVVSVTAKNQRRKSSELAEVAA